MPRTAKVEDQNIIRVVTTTTLTDKEVSNLLFYFGVEKTKLKKLLEEMLQDKLIDSTINISNTVEEMKADFFKPKKVDLSKPTDKKEEKAA